MAPMNPTASNAQDLITTVIPPQPAAADLPALIVKLQNEPWYQDATREIQQAAMAGLIADPSNYDLIMADLVSGRIVQEQWYFNDCVQKYVRPRFTPQTIRGISNFGTLESMIRTGMSQCLRDAEKKTFPDAQLVDTITSATDVTEN